MGILSGLIAGLIVFSINLNHGYWPAFASFAKQFGFNLFMAGFNTRCCEKITRYFNNNILAISMAAIIPTLQAFIILFAVHYFGATPKPFASTIWQVPFNLGIFSFYAFIYKQVINIKNPSFKKLSIIFHLKSMLPVKRLTNTDKTSKQAS